MWGDWFLNRFRFRSERDESEPSDLEREFSLYTGVKRYRVEPSLVNRIGLYHQDFWQNENKVEDEDVDMDVNMDGCGYEYGYESNAGHNELVDRSKISV